MTLKEYLKENGVTLEQVTPKEKNVALTPEDKVAIDVKLNQADAASKFLEILTLEHNEVEAYKEMGRLMFERHAQMRRDLQEDGHTHDVRYHICVLCGKEFRS